MPLSEDTFKKYQEAGAEFLEGARARAEDFLKELAKAADPGHRPSLGALDDLLEGSRKGSEQLVNAIRREISQQLAAVGVATRRELADLERRIRSAGVGRSSKAGGGRTAARETTAKKAGPAKKTAAKKPPANRASTAKKGASAKKAATTKRA